MFTELQSISTITADFTVNNQGSAIHVSSDGRFGYAANRWHNSLAVFADDQETGTLQLVEIGSTDGDWPRDFVLDPTEKYLFAYNQNASNLVLYARNTETGRLTLLETIYRSQSCLCKILRKILFMKLSVYNYMKMIFFGWN